MTKKEAAEENKKINDLIEALSTLLLDRKESGIHAFAALMKMTCEMANALGLSKEDLCTCINEHKSQYFTDEKTN